jgi:hypothetical protein
MALALMTWGSAAAAQPADGDRPLLAAAHREGVRLAQAGGTGGQGAGAPRGNWLVRHPVVAGTAIGAGAGLALSQLDAIGGRSHDPRVALIGAAGGAWGGVIASAVQSARAGKRVGLGTKVGIVAGAVGLAVLPALACYGAGGCGGSS